MNPCAAVFDDFSPRTALPKDACELARNVEFFRSTLGERRAGTEPLDNLPVGITGNASFGGVCWLFRHEPTVDPLEAELWVMTFDTGNVNPRMFRYRLADDWTEIFWINAIDEPLLTDGMGYQVYGQSFHGKLYMAYASSVDRLHVFEEDTNQIRRVGITEMGAIASVTNGGGAGAYPAVERFYRTRGVIMDGSTVVVRGEPTEAVAFTPSGADTNATVTRGSFVDLVETHWEVEGSEDGVTFFLLDTIIAATMTYEDTADPATYVENPQSDPIGSYSIIPSVQYLAVDNDRLLTAGAPLTNVFGVLTAGEFSAVRWTPPGIDPLPGADERLDATTDPRIDLDAAEGGSITGLSQATSGVVFAFKYKAIYKILRTGQLVGAYEADPVTKHRGALPRSIIQGADEAGQPALFFADPAVGPSRISQSGVMWLGHDVNKLWRTVNVSATVPIHGVYYEDKQQLHYWIAATTDILESFPTAKIVLQTNLVTQERGIARGGWSTVPLLADGGGLIGSARCSAMYFDPRIIASTNFKTNFIPYIDGAGAAISVCDRGADDGGTDYTARVRSRVFFLANILNRFGVLAGALLGLADSKVLVRLIRDFGTETLEFQADMTPVGSEEYVIAQLDDLNGAEFFAVQVEFADDPDNPSQWELYQFAMKDSDEQTA